MYCKGMYCVQYASLVSASRLCCVHVSLQRSAIAWPAGSSDPGVIPASFCTCLTLHLPQPHSAQACCILLRFAVLLKCNPAMPYSDQQLASMAKRNKNGTGIGVLGRVAQSSSRAHIAEVPAHTRCTLSR